LAQSAVMIDARETQIFFGGQLRQRSERRFDTLRAARHVA